MAAEPLPTEIIAEILCRLPAKTLIRFLCVSKSWFSQIKNPNFIKRHLNQTLKSNSYRHLLLTHSSLSSSPLNRQFKFSKLNQPLKSRTPSKIHFWGSCNGVICISDSERNDIVLYNPSTKTHRFLPKTEYPYPKEHAVFGFGYDSGNDDYKVLRLMQCCGPINEIYNDARVYSMKKNSWKKVNDLPYNLIYPDNCGVIVNEGLHFIVSEVPFKSKKKSIARFDLESETYSLLECPKCDDSIISWTFYLGNLGGKLSCAVNYDFHGRADVWIMEEYGRKESWIRLLNINRRMERNLIDVKPITLSSNGEMILAVVDGLLHWYDMRGQRGIRSGVLDGMPGENIDAGAFVESLVMLDGDKVCSSGGVHSGGGTTTRKHKKKPGVDDFLTTGFKLRL